MRRGLSPARTPAYPPPQHVARGMMLPAASAMMACEASSLVGTQQCQNYSSLSSSRQQQHNSNSSAKAEPDSYWTIAKNLFTIALPSGASVALTFGLPSITIAYCGRYLGTEVAAAVSVGIYGLNVLALYAAYGLTFAVDTLCAQEFGRDPMSTRQGIFVQRSFFISTIYLVPLTVVVWHCEPLLQFLYEPAIAKPAVEWLKFSPLILFPAVYSSSLSKFCLNQFLPYIPFYALAAAACVLIVVQRILVPNFGVRGSAVGLALAGWMQLLTLAVLIRRHRLARHRFGTWRWKEAIFDRAALVEFLRYGIPSIVFVVAEASAFDSTVLIAGHLGPTPTAAWSDLFSIILVFTYGSSGLSIASCAGVGRALGAGDAATAKRTAALACTLAFAIGVVNSTIMVGFLKQLMSFFTNQPAVVAQARAVVWLVPYLHIADSVQFTLQGIFSGAGQNHTGSVVLVSTLWLLGIGVAVYTTLATRIGLLGVAGGLTLGLLTEAPILVIVAFFFFNWEALARNACILVGKEDGSPSCGVEVGGGVPTQQQH